jgi:hypothetical protein
MIRDTSLAEAVRKAPWWVRALIMAGMIFIIAVKPTDTRTFIYFQF